MVDTAPTLHVLSNVRDGLISCNKCGWETETDDSTIRTIEFCPHCNPNLKREHKHILRIPHTMNRWTVIKGDLWFFSLDTGEKVCYNMLNNRTYHNVSIKFAMEA